MKNINKKLTLGLLLVFLATSAASCGNSNSNETIGAPKQVTLDYWTINNTSGDFTGMIAGYKALYPHVVINVKTFRPDEYENAVINALAEDRGPDIFSIPNDAIKKYQTKIESMPSQVVVNQAIVKGTLKKQTYTQKITKPSLTQRYLEDNFIEQAVKDIQYDGKTYGLPFYVNTLGLFYNKDLLSNAGIAEPAKDYTQLQAQVLKLAKQDRLGNIIQSGVALGTTNNVPFSSDIISLLMMQNGTEMTDDGYFANFDTLPPSLGKRETLPAGDALVYYTDYASPTKQVYNWNSGMQDALQAFIAGKVAYIYGYSDYIQFIRAQAPKLNFDVTNAPQIEGNTQINFARYQVEVVSKKSKNIGVAWDFLQYAVKPGNVDSYLASAKRTTALRSLINKQIEDKDLGPFAEQLLTAHTWYRGNNPQAVNQIFGEMVTQTLSATIEMKDILKNGANKINQTIR